MDYNEIRAFTFFVLLAAFLIMLMAIMTLENMETVQIPIGSFYDISHNVFPLTGLSV